MKVPLLIDSYSRNGRVVFNSSVQNFNYPIRPYIIAERVPYGIGSKEVEMTRIPDMKLSKLYKIELNNLKDLDLIIRQLKAEKIPFFSLPFKELLFTDAEDFFLQWPNTNDLKIMNLDIEVLTTGNGIFPRPETSPIIAIGVKFGTETIFFEDYQVKNKKKEDKDILTDFLSVFKDYNPDVIITHGGTDFDLPYIYKRMELLGLNFSSLNREEYSKEVCKPEKIEIRGRIHLDNLLMARKDQAIMGIKSRGLKAVANWYGYNAKEFGEDIGNTQKHIGTSELREYLRSDVEATEYVGKVYLPTLITLAEIMRVPLGSVVGSFSSFIPKIICSRHCKKLNLIPLEQNVERYGDVDEKEKLTIPGRIATLGTKYEGAIVDIYKTGYFKKLWKVDFAAQYPSAIRTWNIGPDTVRLRSISDYTGKFYIKNSGDKLFLTLPDDNFKKDISIEIDISKPGFLKAEIERLASERARLRKLMSESKGEESKTYDSQQTAVKILLNSIYGYLGAPHSTFGDMICGLAITALCRWTSTVLINNIPEKICEVDTDGLILDQDVDVDKLNELVTKSIKESFGLESFMRLEKEEFLDGYFYKMKNYIVRKEKKGKILTEKHGAAFKSSRYSPLYDSVINEMCELVLSQKEVDQFEIASKLRDISKRKLSDFKNSVTFSRPLSGYEDGLSMQRSIGIQVEERLKTKVDKGLQVDYFVTKNPPPCKPLLQLFNNRIDSKGKKMPKVKGPFYTISQYVTNISQIDKEYYVEQLDKIFKLFGWQYKEQLEMKL